MDDPFGHIDSLIERSREKIREQQRTPDNHNRGKAKKTEDKAELMREYQRLKEELEAVKSKQKARKRAKCKSNNRKTAKVKFSDTQNLSQDVHRQTRTGRSPTTERPQNFK